MGYEPIRHNNHITDQFRRLRNERGLSLDGLAKLYPMFKNVVVRSWETGDRRVTVVQAIEYLETVYGKTLAIVELDAKHVPARRSREDIVRVLRSLIADLESEPTDETTVTIAGVPVETDDTI